MRGRTLFVLLAVLPAALRSVFAASQNPPHPHHGRKRAVFVFAGFLLLTGGTARAQGPVVADRAALVALYNADGGADWTNNTNWLTNEALSEWHGLDTDANGRVTGLRLENNGLIGEIPMELRGLANLQELDLNENMLTGRSRQHWGNWPTSRCCLSASNSLSGEIPLELGGLSKLQLLSLWGNALTGEIPAALGGLSQLRVLIISQNVLRGEIPAELRGLANLEELNLWGNRLSGEIPLELGDLTNLQLLSFRGNALTGEIPAELGNLTNLEELSLNENTLIGRIPAELGDLTNLRVLSLWGNSLSGEIPAELGNLTNLEELSLSSNGLSGPLPLTLPALSQLSVLDIRSTTLCAPPDTAFQVWLATINFQGAVCAAPGPGGGGGGGGPRQTVPDAPINLMAEATDGTVTLTWAAPEDDGGSAVTDYQYRINRRGSWISISSIQTTHTVTGLVNGTAYIFQVRAVNAAGNSAPSNRAEATPGVGALDFAHFANGAGIISDLVFVNVAPHPIRPILYFCGQEGHLMDPESVVDLTEDLEVTEDGALSVRTEMEPLGELTISTHGRGEVVTGSVTVISEGPIGGVLRFDLPGIGVAGVGASQPVRDALFPARRQTGGIATAAAVRNLGEEAMGVSCRLMSAGVALEEAEIHLEANGQTSWFIEDTFTTTDTSGFAGSVRCTAPGEGMFTGVAVELDAGNQIFTTLPVVVVER